MATYKVDGNEIDGKYFSADQKRDDRFVSRVAREYGRLQMALRRFAEFRDKNIVPVFIRRTAERDIDKETKEISGKGVTIYNISKTRRVVIKQPMRISMNDLAQSAKEIIDAKIKQFEEQLPEDMADLFGLLKGMFVEKKRMMFTPAIAAFVGMVNLKDKDLKKAQELLRRSLDSQIGKVWVVAEWKKADGSWVK